MLSFTTPPKKIAILRLSALGDCILLVPTIRRIQAYWPETEITWIIEKQLHSLLKGVNGVNFYPIEKPKNWSDYKKLKSELTHHSFDILLAMQASLRANLIYPLIQAKIKIGFDKKRSRDFHGLFITHRIEAGEDHLLEAFQRFADFLQIPATPPEWRITLPNTDCDWAADQLHTPTENYKVIAINPAASKLERTAYAEFYAEIINKINQTTTALVILTGGPADWEIGLSNQIVEMCHTPPLNLVGKTSFRQIAALLAKSDLLIAPDTGPAHIANAYGTPVIGLYAVAPPKLSAPYLSQDLVINKFPQAVREIQGVDPDKIPWGFRVHDRKAMTLFKSTEVLTLIERVLTERDSE